MAANTQLAKQSRLDSVRTFVQDEDGLEAIQVVMIVAIAALILIVFMTFWDKIKGWASGMIDNITGNTP